MELREYQKQHCDNVISAVSKHQRIIAHLPTGGGKTVEFCHILKRYTEKTGKNAIIIVDRIELLYQAQRTIKKVVDIDAFIINSSQKRFKDSSVYIAMVESLKNRMDLICNIGLVIIDEAHVASFNKIHDAFIDSYIIGFTATPISSSKKNPLINSYNKIVVGPQINQLIKQGHLVQNITKCPKDIVDTTNISIDQKSGDYNTSDLYKAFRSPKLIKNTIAYYSKYCLGEKTIIFNVNKEHSREVCELMQICGYNARNLDSDCSEEERKDILDWYSRTPDAILCNVMIATVGFDEPTIKNVILNFSTLSIVKFIQTCGRGSRPSEGKTHFKIIDLGGNAIRFGDWNDDRDWEKIFYNPEKVTDGIAPMKSCPSCNGLVHASRMICNLEKEDGSICNHEFARKQEAEEGGLSEMVVITKNIDIDSIMVKSIGKHEYYAFLEMGYYHVKNMFDKLKEPTQEQIDEVFKVYYNDCCEWYKRAVSGKPGRVLDISNDDWHIKRAKNNFDNLIKKIA